MDEILKTSYAADSITEPSLQEKLELQNSAIEKISKLFLKQGQKRNLKQIGSPHN